MNILWDNIFRRPDKEHDVRAALKANPLFADLGVRDLAFVESVVHVRRFHTGEEVFRQGEIGVGMYIILKGRIEILVTDPLAVDVELREIHITQLGEGDFFGELSLAEDNGRRTATALSRDESTLVGFFKPDLVEILERSPSTGGKIAFRLAEVLGRRLKETTDKVSELRLILRELRAPPPMEHDAEPQIP